VSKKKKGKKPQNFHGKITMVADDAGTVHFYVPSGPDLNDKVFSFGLGMKDAAAFALTIIDLIEEHAAKSSAEGMVGAKVFDLFTERVKREGEQFERTD